MGQHEVGRGDSTKRLIRLEVSRVPWFVTLVLNTLQGFKWSC